MSQWNRPDAGHGTGIRRDVSRVAFEIFCFNFSGFFLFNNYITMYVLGYVRKTNRVGCGKFRIR